MAGEDVTIEDLRRMHEECFSNEDYPDFTFEDGNLTIIEGRKALFVPSAMPGGITVIDNSGYVVIADQKESVFDGSCDGTYVFLDNFLSEGVLEGTWKIRYNRGIKGDDADATQLSEASGEELMVYSIIFS